MRGVGGVALGEATGCQMGGLPVRVDRWGGRLPGSLGAACVLSGGEEGGQGREAEEGGRHRRGALLRVLPGCRRVCLGAAARPPFGGECHAVLGLGSR